MRLIHPLVSLLLLIQLTGCNSDDPKDKTERCASEGLLETFTTIEGEEFYIYENGELYIYQDDACVFAAQYFDSDFLTDNYVTNESVTFIITDSGELFPTKNNYFEDFEGYTDIVDVFISNLEDIDSYWSSMTLQSPSAPTVPDYVALQKCIMDGSCTFIDNRIDLVVDPTDASNQVMKFTSVAPTAQMVTAKSSISSTLSFFTKNSDFWFQADYYIEEGMPFSLADFENSHFLEGPGPRIVIRNDKVSIENKFGSKLNFTHNMDVLIPKNSWFTIKVHFKYSNENDGIIELWQDGIQLISTAGINLPTSNSIQNRVELGVTATPIGCVMLMDEIRISETPF